MTLNVYLTFKGDCLEAFEFYRSVFGGEFAARQTFGDGPAEMGVAEADADKIMHVSLPVGDSVLMGSDALAGHGGDITIGDNFSISYAPPSREETDRVFAMLAEGGEVTMPLQDMFWGAYFGSCRDKFGVNWMLNHETG